MSDLKPTTDSFADNPSPKLSHLKHQRSRSSSLLSNESGIEPKNESDIVIKSLSNSSSLLLSKRKRSSSTLQTNILENNASSFKFKQTMVLSSSHESVLASNFGDSMISTIPKPTAKLLKFTVSCPLTSQTSNEKESNAFIVNVSFPNGEQKTLIRRFRQFFALHQAVQKSFPEVELPRFPKKTIFKNHSNEKRRKKFEAYLNFVLTIPGIENLLGLVTFLGSDIFQGYKHDESNQFNDIIEKSEPNDELKITQDRRYNEVEHFIMILDKCISRIEAIEDCFDHVYDTSDFIKVSEFSKLVVLLGKLLGKIPSSKEYKPKELTEEQIISITNPKILSIRKKITPAISEIIHKLNGIKESLLDVNLPMDQILELQHVIDDIQEVYNNSNIIVKTLGYIIEGGLVKNEIEKTQYPKYVDDNIYWYKKEFYGNDHIVCFNNTPVGDYVIALKAINLFESSGEFRVYSCNKDGNECLTIKVNLATPSLWKTLPHIIITKADLRLRGIEWHTCEGKDVESHILEHESRDMRITRKLKFGILLCLQNQIKEEDMFSNEVEIPSFKNFLDILGKRIELSGFSGFAGGLDTRGSDTTGKYSIITTHKGPPDSDDFHIMFHVSTMLPNGEQDQQLAKKRHIGNDIVLLVFQEEGSGPYHPSTVKSNYIQIIIVVKVIHSSDGKYFWHVNVSSAQDVPFFGPPLPYPPIFEDRNVLSQWLLEKMVNAELASYNSKLFIKQLRNTYKTLLQSLIEKMPYPKKKGSRNSHKKK